MNAIRYYLLVVLASYALCHPERASAQSANPDELGIKASAAYTAPETVVVRWAPVNFKSWELGSTSVAKTDFSNWTQL